MSQKNRIPASDHPISLSMAVLINLNIMLGAGIFINTTVLARTAGFLGFVGYGIIAIFMLPLILCIARLLFLHPSGGFYTFGAKEISSFAGFLSTWSYFVGKIASCILMIHVSSSIALTYIPHQLCINHYMLDLIILTVFIFLNTMNVTIGNIIQKTLVSLKSIPIFTAIIIGILSCRKAHIMPEDLVWTGIPSLLPIVLYSALGFEAACSLSSRIQNAQKNAARAVIISFGLAMGVAALYQLSFYISVGHPLATLPNYRYVFPALFQPWLLADHRMGMILIGLMSLAIIFSALGGSYSIIFSNTWNLHTLALHNHTFFAPSLLELNRHGIPWLCVVVQGCIAALYLYVCKGAQIPLQQISNIGSIIAYTISVISLLMLYVRSSSSSLSSYVLVISALISCITLASGCIFSLLSKNCYIFVTFMAVVLFGVGMFVVTKPRLSKRWTD